MKLNEASEAQLARVVVTELQRQGYVTYEEVSTGYAERRADIVAMRGPVVAVVECKTQFSMRLMDQLTRWLGQAHVVIGASGFCRLGVAAERYLKSQGLGLWTVGAEEIHEKVAPRLWRRADTRWTKRYLKPEQRSGESAAAGSQGGYWTPFRATCRDLERVVGEQPGIELRAALRLVKHHYANEKSAVSAIPDVIKRGLLPGIRVEGRPLKLYPVSPGATGYPTP